MLLLLLAAGVFILIGIRTDWSKTFQAVGSANLIWVGGAIGVMMISHWLRAARWTMLTEPAGYKLNKRRSFYSVMAGYLVNVATSRGGEVVRCALTAKSEKAPLELLIGTVVTERIVDLAMLILVCIGTLLTQFDLVYDFFAKYIITPLSAFLTLKNIAILVAIVVLGIVGILFLRRRNKNKQKAENIADEKGIKGIINRFTGGLKTVFKLKSPIIFLLYSMGIWVGYWLSGYCLLQSLEITHHLGLFVGLGLLVFSAVGIAIPLPAGAGVWGALAFGLTTVYGIPSADAETYGIYNLAFSNLLMIVTGAICYILLWLEMQKLEKNAA